MGAERNSGTRKQFVNIFKGNFEMRAEALDKNKPWIVERTTKTGKVLIVDTFDTLSGYLDRIDYVPDSPVGKRLHITISSDKHYVIDIPYIGDKGWVSSYAQKILLSLGNIDLTKEISLTPYSFIPKDEQRNKEGWVIKQDGEKVLVFVDITTIPKADKKEDFDGNMTYDPTMQTKYYHDLMKKWSTKVQEVASGKTVAQAKAESMQRDVNYEGQRGPSGGNEDLSHVPVTEPEINFDGSAEEQDDDLPF